MRPYQWIAQTVHQAHHEGELESCEQGTCRALLAEADRMDALVRACEAAQEMYGPQGENEGERFDRLAELFWKETGVMRPGKSMPIEMHSVGSDAQRTQTWIHWFTKRQALVRELLAAALVPAERG